MKILTITSSYPKYARDTTAPFIASITKALASRGHELTVVLPAHRDLDLEPVPGVRFRPYRYAPTQGLSVFGYAESLRADVALRGATYLAAPLALVSGTQKLLSESYRERYDVLHAHWVVPNGTMAWPVSKARGLPLVVSLHGSDVFMSEKKGAFRSAAKLAFSQARAATACSDDLAMRSLALGATEKPRVVPYGVDIGLFGDEPPELRQSLGIEKDALVILAVGRLVHKKGIEFLVDAAAALGQEALHVVIAGKGDLRPALEERARQAGLYDRTHFVGNVERDALPDYFAMADIVAVPSVRDGAGNVDGLPNVLLEAMASGTAIVASDVGGIPQAIRAGEDGLLVPEKDPGSLAEALRKLASSSDLRKTLGASARKRAEQDFSWDLVGKRFESVLRSVSEARRRAS